MSAIYDFHQGAGPLLISVPHGGEIIPDDVAARLTPKARRIVDTDWHVPVLYDFAKGLGASMICATHSRYVVDLNRGTEGAKLYPGMAETGLCPTETFDGDQVYLDRQGPDDAERHARIETYWLPYHGQLAATLAAIKERHGYALLFDAHSIVRHVPRLFDGDLPDLNLGTGGGTSCDARLAETLFAIGRGSDFTCVLNGRFKGGYITRHYGQPENGVHAVQMELSQDLYLDGAMPPKFDAQKADRLQAALRKMLQAMIAFRP